QAAPGNIHALPEGGGAEERCALIVAEAAENLGAGAVAVLGEGLDAFISKAMAQGAGHLVERAQAGEQHERAAVSRNDVLEDDISKLRLVAAVASAGPTTARATAATTTGWPAE